MFRAAGRCLTVLALCLALGWHWAALQGVAWTTMLIRNATTCSFAEAMEKTFDGGHLCSLCHMVREGMAKSSNDMTARTSDSRPQPVKVTKSAKPDLFCSVRSVPLANEYRELSYEVKDVEVVERRGAPPLRPPRLLLS
ncbi:MAG: hypothetical protein ACRD5Z_14975 [Bryobacteraceae bacterium]